MLQLHIRNGAVTARPSRSGARLTALGVAIRCTSLLPSGAAQSTCNQPHYGRSRVCSSLSTGSTLPSKVSTVLSSSTTIFASRKAHCTDDAPFLYTPFG